MATFPAVIPDASRSYTPGLFGAEQYQHAGGVEVRFLTSLVPIADRFSLNFTLRDEDTVELIRDHFIGQEGGSLPFALSEEVLAGFPVGDLLAPDGFAWVYAEPISIEQVTPKLFNITVQLESVDVGAGVQGGTRLTLGFTFSGGAAVASAAAPGAALTLTPSFNAGSAGAGTVILLSFEGGKAGGGAAGAELSLDFTFTSYGAGGGATGTGQTLTAAFTAGVASGS